MYQKFLGGGWGVDGIARMNFLTVFNCQKMLINFSYWGVSVKVPVPDTGKNVRM